MEVLPSEKGTLSLYFVLDREAGVFQDNRKKEPKGYPKIQLYNLNEDPGEKINPYGKHAKIVEHFIILFNFAIKNMEMLYLLCKLNNEKW